jgi:hypothetical protein
MLRRVAGNVPSAWLQWIERIGLIANCVRLSGDFVPASFLLCRKNLQYDFSVSSVMS